MNVKSITLSFLLALSFSLYAQDDAVNWGEIPPEDLQMTVYEYDTAAAALVLADIGLMQINADASHPGYVLSVHRRVKILNKKGLDEGDVSLVYYHREGYEKIKRLKAQVFSPNGDVYKLGNKEFFKEEINDNYTSINFAFPKLEVGSVLEYRYDLVSEGFVQPRAWYFQTDLPVKYGEFRMKNESYFSYLTLFEGGERMQATPLPGGKYLFKDDETTLEIGNLTYKLKDAPALKEEAYITTMSDYNMRIRLQLSAVNYPGQPSEPFFTTWEDAAKELREDPAFGQQYRKKRNYNKILDSVEPLIKDQMTDLEKAKVIYAHLSKTIKWNEKYRTQPEGDNLDEAVKKQTGNSADLNLLMLGLLNYFDIKAYPVLTSTRSHGKMMPDYPIMDQFNHVLGYVELDGRSYLIDVSDPLRPMGVPSLEALSKKGWLITEEGQVWTLIQAPLNRDNIAAEVELSEEGVLSGKLRATFNCYSALGERVKHSEDKDGEYWKTRLGNSEEEVTIEQYSVKNIDDIYEDVETDLIFTVESAAQKAGDFLYFTPCFYGKFDENPFKLERRKYPVDFAYPMDLKFIAKVKIPEGYEVVELPELASFSLPKNMVNYKFICSEKEGAIQIFSNLSISESVIEPKYYKQIKELFEKMIEKQGEQVVLRKKT